MTETQEPQNYGVDSITVLEGLEAVRMRPAMYIGDTDVRGLHHLIWEVIDNSVDEALNGPARHIEVELRGEPGPKARERLEKMCRELLANMVIEDFRVEL